MKKIVLFTQVNGPLINQIKKVMDHLNPDNHEFHLVHCHKIQYFINELSVYTFPTEEHFEDMTKATNTVLEELAKEMGLKHFGVHTFFDTDPKERCATFLEDIEADLCVVATEGVKGIEGIFESSFANHMNKYAKCDVLVLRP